MHYYIIHNPELPYRKINMIKILKENDISLNDVTWMIYPNKKDITEELKNRITDKNCSLPNGYISCTYKHYLSIKDMIENNYNLAVIMEDNIGGFRKNVKESIEKYLEQLPNNWDILFDGWESEHYIEGPIFPDKLVYLKNNDITGQCAGSTKSAQFYMLNLDCAKKLYENFIPFNDVPDKIYNFIFRKLNMKSYWVEPTNQYLEQNHISSGF